VTDTVDDSDRGNSTTDDGQNTDSQVVKWWILLFVYNVDWLDLSVEMNLLERFITWSLACS
jgi:hypothetical protein